MEALTTISTVAPPSLIQPQFPKSIFSLSFTQTKCKSPLLNLTRFPNSKFTKLNVISPSVSTQPAAPPEEETETQTEHENFVEDEKFDWFSHWYPLMPVCDLDKKAPLGKKVLGLDVVVWWDRNENAWKVFDDRCPHRLAPLSEGRIDQWGRLQCVYHGWCFGGSGDCKLIPQAPLDGPPVHSSPKACAGVYPSTVQYGIVWFWPSTDPQYKDILTKKKPPYISELAHPSYPFQLYHRDIPQGYEICLENIMDPSHVQYAHTGIIMAKPVDREGGEPIDMKIQKSDKNGFTTTNQDDSIWSFASPYQFKINLKNYTKGKFGQKAPEEDVLVFFCVPVSPGNCRLITVLPRHLWVNQFYLRWRNHMIQNLIIDSDLYLLRVQEEKLLEAGPLNWQKASFVPSKADFNVVLYRKWLKKYAGGQFDWGTKFNGVLAPTAPREQFMDRYWSHVVNCNSCSGAYKGFKALEISLQVFSIASVAIMAANKPGMISIVTRNTLALAAILCFAGSKWLSRFIHKTFHFHDYNHAFK